MCVWQNIKKKQKKKKKSRVVINVAYFNQDINSKLTIFFIIHQLNIKQHQKSIQVLLISRTTFKSHANSNKSK